MLGDTKAPGFSPLGFSLQSNKSSGVYASGLVLLKSDNRIHLLLHTLNFLSEVPKDLTALEGYTHV